MANTNLVKVVDKNGVSKMVDRKLAKQYALAGWQVIETKQQPTYTKYPYGQQSK